MPPKDDKKKKKNRLQGGGAPRKAAPAPPAPSAGGGGGAAPPPGGVGGGDPAGPHDDPWAAAPPRPARGASGWGEGRPDCGEEEEYALANLKYIRGAEIAAGQMPARVLLIRDFISSEEEELLLQYFDEQQVSPWDSSLSRRTQQWGWRFDYERMSVSGRGEPFPEVVRPIVDRIVALRGREEAEGWPEIPRPDQMIVNEYTPGQGIHAHIDRDCFSDVVASIGMASSCTMVFDKPSADESSRKTDLDDMPTWLAAQCTPSSTEIPLFFPRRALLIFCNHARWGLTHAIPARTWDEDSSGRRVQRGRRVSLTLRRMSAKGLEKAGEPAAAPARGGYAGAAAGVTMRGGTVAK